MTKQELFEFISKTRLGVLSSIAADGSPQSALVGIAVSPELEIIFDTVKNSRKYVAGMPQPLELGRHHAFRRAPHLDQVQRFRRAPASD